MEWTSGGQLGTCVVVQELREIEGRGEGKRNGWKEWSLCAWSFIKQGGHFRVTLEGPAVEDSGGTETGCLEVIWGRKFFVGLTNCPTLIWRVSFRFFFEEGDEKDDGPSGGSGGP